MRGLILGATGLLGKRVCQDARERGWEISGVARSGTDFSIDFNQPQDLLNLKHKLRADIIINCAALTDLDYCEQNLTEARMVNAESVEFMSQLAKEWGAYFVQVSTDHFFRDGGNIRHSEDHPVQIVNNYAKTKFEGEKIALQNKNTLIVRTNIIGFRLTPHKNTYLEWLIKQFLSQNDFFGFVDFFTSGMSVGALSEILLELCEFKRPTGLWNIAGSEVFSKYSINKKIAEVFGISAEKMHAGSVSNYPGAPRAFSLGLDVSRIEALLRRKMPTSEETVQRLFQEYRDSQNIRDFIHNVS